MIGNKQNSESLLPTTENNVLAMHEPATKIKNKISREGKKSRETES